MIALDWPCSQLVAARLSKKVVPDIAGLMQNGADQDKACLFSVIHRVRLKAKATKTMRDFAVGPAYTGNAGKRVECALQPGVIGLGLISTESFLGVIVNLDKVAFRPFRKAELTHAGPRRVAARRSTRRPWSPC